MKIYHYQPTVLMDWNDYQDLIKRANLNDEQIKALAEKM